MVCDCYATRHSITSFSMPNGYAIPLRLVFYCKLRLLCDGKSKSMSIFVATPATSIYQMRAVLNSSAFGTKQSSPRKWSRRRFLSPDQRSRSPCWRRWESPRKRVRSKSPFPKDYKDARPLKRSKQTSPRKASNCTEESSFRHGATPRGVAVCAICLGRHEHDFSKC